MMKNIIKSSRTNFKIQMFILFFTIICLLLGATSLVNAQSQHIDIGYAQSIPAIDKLIDYLSYPSPDWDCLTNDYPNNYPTSSTWYYPSPATETNHGFGLVTNSQEYGYDKYHLGEDYPATTIGENVGNVTEYDYVKAASNGVVVCVVSSYNPKNFGHSVWVQSILPDNTHITTIYGHLGSVGLVEKGTIVKAGETIIGRMGMNSVTENGGFEPHLHVGVLKGFYKPFAEQIPAITVFGYTKDISEVDNWIPLSSLITNTLPPINDPIGITIFTDSNFGGNRLTLIDSDDDLCDNIISGQSSDPSNACHMTGILTWNDNISSIKLSPGYNAVLLLHSRQIDIDQYGQHQARFSCNKDIPDLRELFFDGTNIPLNDNISAIIVAKCSEKNPSILMSSMFTENEYDPCSIIVPTNVTDQVEYITDITLPDGTISSQNFLLIKTWRLQNTGTTTWDSGYKLVFVSGEQMGAPAETTVPTTAPNQTVDISIPIKAPSSSGEHTGYFQLRNPQGTYFGPKIWVKIKVQSGSSKITVLSADPPSPADTRTVRISAKVEGMSNLRAIRLKVDGQIQGEFGGPEYTFTWDTSSYSVGAHSITIEAADQTDTSWSRPEVRSMSYTLLGTAALPNLKPNMPKLNSPYNWYVYYSGNTANLCAQADGDPDGDAISEYYFEIYESAQNWNSGWIGSNCITTGSLGPYDFKWHVKVRDSRGAESDWSESRNFTIVNPNLSITDLSFESLDGNSETVRIHACTAGQGGIGITMRVDINDANDGSSNGEWHRLYELGVPCFTDVDAPLWRTLEAGGSYGDGAHLVRVEAHGLNTGWDGAAVMEKTYTLPHRRPEGFKLTAPVSATGNNHDPIYLDSKTVTFDWGDSSRATSYILSVDTSTNPSGVSNPIFRKTFDASVTETTVIFDQDYPALYWQVRAINDKGEMDTTDQLIGIDQTTPTCSIGSMDPVSYENNFQVIWFGSDTPAGIRSFDIQYMDSTRGEWNDWLTGVPSTKTFDLFLGQAGHTYYFRCRSVDNTGNSGIFPASADGIVMIDPASRPAEVWWNSGYAHKRNITIQNNMTGVNIPTGYPVSVIFNSGTTPTATELYASSLSSSKCDDLRVVYDNTTEINRVVRKCSATEIEIWFRSQASVASGQLSTVHQLYYGNSTPGTVLNDPSQVWYPYLESGTTNLYFFQEGAGSGTITYDSSGNNRNCTIGPATQWGTGKFGSGIQVSQQSSGGIRSLVCGNAPLVNAFTIEFWIKTSSDTDGRLIGALGGGGNGGSGNNWMIDYRGRLHLEVWPCSSCASHSVESNFDLRNSPYRGQWNYVVVTFDGGNLVNFYINGNWDSTKTIPDQTGMNTYTVPLEIGAVESSGHINASIGGLRISNFVRTSFPYGQYSQITTEPTTRINDPIAPPVIGTPDLVIQSLNSYLDSNGNLLVETVVYNQGTQSTTNGFYTDLYVNHLPTGAGDFEGSKQFWVNDPIPAGESATLTTVLGDLLGAQSGLNFATLAPGQEETATIYVQTDSTGALIEEDKANNISDGAQACFVASDAYEGDDDTYVGAIVLDGSQIHNFDHPGDEDWVKLVAKEGQTFRIATSNLGSSADTYLYLYEQDGVTLLASNDDYGGTLASQIEWTAPADGTFFLQIKQWNPSSGGCATSYTIGISGSSIYLPMIIR